MTNIITRPKIYIEPSVIEKLKTVTREESQVVIHCLFDAEKQSDCLIRIWPTTFLYDTGSAHRSELVHVDNISMYPIWTEVPNSGTVSFSLIFTGLPKDCSTFDLFEEIPQSGGFKATGIKRNDSDIYFIKV